MFRATQATVTRSLTQSESEPPQSDTEAGVMAPVAQCSSPRLSLTSEQLPLRDCALLQCYVMIAKERAVFCWGGTS